MKNAYFTPGQPLITNGEAQVPLTRSIDVSTLAQDLGMRLKDGDKNMIGKIWKKMYFETYGEEPSKHDQFVSGAVRKVICSFPRQVDSWHFDAKYHAGEIELELVPQGNLAERIRAAGAGIGAFFTPSGFGTTLADGKETRHIDGRDYVLEYPITADYALIKAHKADRWGNLLYRKTSRNFGPIMAMAATTTIVQVPFLAELGELDPENIVTPGIFVDRVVQVASTNPKEHS
jgi:3-oxoacid CoA-transferase A subunit